MCYIIVIFPLKCSEDWKFSILFVVYYIANLKQDMAENPESQEFADLWERNLM